MFGATAVRQKRERERRDRLARGVKVSSRVETKIPNQVLYIPGNEKLLLPEIH